MEHFHRFGGFFCCGHFHKGEAARLAGELVEHHVNGAHDTCGGEILLQVVVHGLVRKIPHEETRIIHNQYTLAVQKTEWGVAALAVALNVALNKFPTICLSDTDTVVLCADRKRWSKSRPESIIELNNCSTYGECPAAVNSNTLATA